jgi:tetratricopeptide (TPR) repeat protein
MALVALAFFVPGRVQGHYYRDLFTGRKLMDARRWSEALPHLESFLDQVRARPGLKKLMWLGGIYTYDVEAMALNNIGAACLELGQLDAAEAPLRQALAVDASYPIPFVNLAVLASLRGDRDGAAAASAAAKQLGFDGSSIDALIRRGQSILAGVEGRA